MTDKYILQDGKPVPCNDLMEWARFFEKSDRVIRKDQIGDVLVSTVFLGLDHSFGGMVPILYESMIFGGPHDQEQLRYSNEEDALKGHAEMLKLASNPGQAGDR